MGIECMEIGSFLCFSVDFKSSVIKDYEIFLIVWVDRVEFLRGVFGWSYRFLGFFMSFKFWFVENCVNYLFRVF